MRWEALPINTTFERARVKQLYRKLASVVKRVDNELVPLDSLQEKIRLFDQTYIGVQPIRVSQIVGTATRREEFSEGFLPSREDVRDRWMSLERAFPDSEFPPIVVYQVGDSYFVVDGHHRVAIAKRRKIEFIDAEVTVLKPRFDVPPGADIGRLIHAEQHQRFMEESGLEKVVPDAAIELTAPHEYIELLELIKVHAYHLSKERNEVVPIEEAARDFYDRVYLPTVDAIKQEGLDEEFVDKTAADLFLLVYECRRVLFPERGSMDLTEVVREAPPRPKRTPMRKRKEAGPTVK